jgi:hypothetical protein
MFDTLVKQLTKPMTEKQVQALVKKIPVVSVKVKKYK